MIWVEPSPYGEDEFLLYVGGCSHPDIDYWHELERAVNDSPFSKWFEKAERGRKHAHVANIWSPVPTPFKDNVLITGDAGWTVEAECTGSMMCGLKAANAISEAMREDKHNREGVQNYIDWWQRHFPDSTDYKEFLNIVSSGLVGEDDANYLRKLVTETLPCSLNPYNLFNNVNASIMKNIGKIQQERPELLARMQKIGTLPEEIQMKEFIVSGFPNY